MEVLKSKVAEYHLEEALCPFSIFIEKSVDEGRALLVRMILPSGGDSAATVEGADEDDGTTTVEAGEVGVLF